MSFIEFYWVLLLMFLQLFSFSSGVFETLGDWLSVTGFYLVLPSEYWVLLSVTGFSLVLPWFTEFYLSVTGFFLGFT